jgi:Pyruvate/2-oxoacid:ferredoxin oxidoreductase delta subunit
MCFDCEKCWMFCQNECFSKEPAARRGKYYRMVLDACIGCKKCAAVCPSGFLDWV